MVPFSNGDFSQIQANESRFNNNSFIQFYVSCWYRSKCRMERQSICILYRSIYGDGKHVFTNFLFQDCRFEDSSFYEINFDDSTWTDCIADGCDFRYSSFINAKLQNVNLSNCDLAHVDFTGCSLKCLKFTMHTSQMPSDSAMHNETNSSWWSI